LKGKEMSPLRTKHIEHKFRYCFAASTLGVGMENGMVIHLVRDAVWASDDPLVIQRPELFVDEPTLVCRTTAPTTVGELRGERLP
jgi:hypothetical protein